MTPHQMTVGYRRFGKKHALSIFGAIRQMQRAPPKRLDVPIGLHQQPFISQVTNHHTVYMQIVQVFTLNPT
jgi:hypothetical protein